MNHFSTRRHACREYLVKASSIEFCNRLECLRRVPSPCGVSRAVRRKRRPAGLLRFLRFFVSIIGYCSEKKECVGVRHFRVLNFGCYTRHLQELGKRESPSQANISSRAPISAADFRGTGRKKKLLKQGCCRGLRPKHGRATQPWGTHTTESRLKEETGTHSWRKFLTAVRTRWSAQVWC